MDIEIKLDLRISAKLPAQNSGFFSFPFSRSLSHFLSYFSAIFACIAPMSVILRLITCLVSIFRTTSKEHKQDDNFCLRYNVIPRSHKFSPWIDARKSQPADEGLPFSCHVSLGFLLRFQLLNRCRWRWVPAGPLLRIRPKRPPMGPEMEQRRKQMGHAGPSRRMGRALSGPTQG